MAAKDAEAAYALFAPRAQQEVPISLLQNQTDDKNYGFYEGYQSLSVQDLKVSLNLPYGTTAEVNATTTYANNIRGTLKATLQKVGGTWRILGFKVTVPPDKLEE
jgi:hypothetical protein